MQENQIVETAEITVDSVWPPKPGGKWGNVKTTTGDAYFGPPALLKLFQKGETCKIEYTLGGKDGKLKAIKHKNEIPRAMQRPQAAPPRARTDPTDSERMWCCAILESFIKAGKVELTIIELAEANKIVRAAYANSFGSNQPAADMGDDQIPY